jgi:hypothetical protein
MCEYFPLGPSQVLKIEIYKNNNGKLSPIILMLKITERAEKGNLWIIPRCFLLLASRFCAVHDYPAFVFYLYWRLCTSFLSSPPPLYRLILKIKVMIDARTLHNFN